MQSSEHIGCIQATNCVNLVARVAAFLDQRLFSEGAEVKKGDLLYRLEQAPFQADVQMREAAVAQFKAQLENAKLTLGRARSLLGTSAGQQSSVDTALAAHLAFEAQKHGAEALLEEARINLAYTEIHAPIYGKICRTAVTEGNYVGPNTGVLVSIVSQDPIYALFPISTRNVIQLRRRTAEKPGSIVIRLRLPDGQLYDKPGTLDFVDNTVSGNTDTMTLRGIVPNPQLPSAAGTLGSRELVDGELVTVILQDAQATEALTVPRAAVLTDQSGDYVFVVGAEDKVAAAPRPARPIDTAALAVVMSGLTRGRERHRRGAAARPARPGGVARARQRHPSPRRPPLQPPRPRRRPPMFPPAAPAAAAWLRPATVHDLGRLHPLPAAGRSPSPSSPRMAGAIALTRILVAQFPDIVPPRVQVTASYPGASAAVVEAAVAQPLEAQIVGVDKMIYMKSTSANDGSYSLTVSFAVGTNPDTDTVNVNNRVQTALPQLPQAVQLQGLTVIKRSAAILQFLNIYSDDGKLSPVFITSYATINVLDELSRVPGVGQALLFGKLNYSMRIWFDTQRLTSLNLSPSDVISAIQAQNVQAPVGRIGARPVSNDQQFQINVQTQGTLTTPASSATSCCAPIPTARCCA